MKSLTTILDNISLLEAELVSLKDKLEQERNSMFSSIVEISPNFTAIVKQEKFIYVNTMGLSLLKCENSTDIVGKSIYDFIDKKIHDTLKDMFNKEIYSDVNNLFNIEMHTTEGGSVWLEFSSKPFIYNDNKAVLIVGRDVTNELIQKRKLEEEENLRTLILNSFSELISFYDPNHKIRWMNDAAQKYYGITDDSYIGNYCYSVRFGADKPCADCPMLLGKTEQYERIVYDKDKIWQVRHIPLFAAQGVISGYVELSVDVTQKEKRKAEFEEAQNRLKESEQRFREIFENSHDGLFLLEVTDDLRFKNLDFNAALEASTGIVRSEHLGKFQDEVVSEEIATEVYKGYRYCVEEKKPIIDSEIELKLPIGTRTYLSSLVPICDMNGNVYRIMGIARDITDQKQMDELLKKKQKNLEEAQRIGKVGSWEVAMPNKKIENSEELCRIFEFDPQEEDIVAERFLSVIHPDDKDHVVKMRIDSLKSKKRYQLEYRLLFADGRVKYLQEYCEPFFDDAGNLMRNVGVVQDITEQKQHIQKIEMLDFALNKASDAIFITNKQNELFHYVNEEACRSLGYSRDELKGLSVSNIDPNVDFTFLKKINSEIQIGKPLVFESRHKAKDGRIFPVEVASNLYCYGDGVYRLAIVRDVTERKNAEAMLKEAHQRLSAIITTIPDLVWMKDVNGVYLSCNKSCELFFGATESEIVGRTDYDFVDADLADFFRQNDLAAMSAGVVCISRESVRYASDNRQRILETRKVPVCGANGEIVGVLGIGRDITKEGQIQEKIEMLGFALNNASDAVFISGEKDANFIYVNDEACRSVGYKREELLGMTVFDVDLDATVNSMRMIDADIALGKPSIIESRYMRNDGTIFPVEITNTRYQYNSKRYLMTVVRDISERLELEGQLTRFAANVPGFIFTSHMSIDGHFSFPYTSRGIHEIYGLQPNDVKYDMSSLHMLAHPDDRSRIETMLKNSAMSLKADRVEYRVVRPGYLEKWVSCELTPEKQADGSILWYGIILDITEQQQSLQHIEMLTFALDNATDAIFILEEELIRFAYVNSEACRSLGYSREELLGMTIFDINLDVTIDTIRQISVDLTLGKPSVLESRYRKKNGSIIPVEMTSTRYQYGGKTYVMNIVHDISERKLAEAALLEERKLFIGGPNVAFKWKAVDGWPVEYVSPNIFDQFGYLPEDLTSGKISILSIVHPDDLELVVNEIRQYNERAMPYFEQEYRIICANGDCRWVYDFTVVVRAVEGDVTYYKGYLTDITERKEKENALIEAYKKIGQSEQRYREVFDNSHDSILVLEILENSQFMLIDINTQCEREIGIAREYAVGRTLDENATPESADLVRKKYQKCIDLGVPIEEFAELEMPKGLRRIHTILIPIRDVNGRIYRIMSVARDVTEHDKTKQQLEINQSLLSHAEVVTSIGYFYIDFPNDEFHCSKGVYNILGLTYNEESVDRLDIFEYVHPDDIQRVKAALTYAFVHKTKFNDIHRIVDANGIEKVMRSSASFVTDSQNSELLLGNIQDVSDLYSLRDKVILGEEKLRILAENSPVGLYILSGRTPLYVNQALLDLLGVNSMDAFLKLNPFDLVHPDDKNSLIKLSNRLFDDVALTPFSSQLTVRGLETSGRLKIFDLRFVACWMAGNKYLQIMVIDVTDEMDKERMMNQLASDSLYMSKKKDAIISVRNELNDLLKTKNYRKEDFRNITSILEAYSKDESDWGLFNKYFENLHPGFITNLKIICPTLTLNDIKHCSCIRLNIDTKETARFFNVTPASIQTSRVRLKKKLNLPEGVDLWDFIASL